jgi:hypothetical protein
MPERIDSSAKILRRTLARLQQSEQNLRDAKGILSSTQDRISSTQLCLKDSQQLIDQFQRLGIAGPTE